MTEFDEDKGNVTSLPVRGRKTLKVIKADHFLTTEPPPREWLVRDLVPARAVTLLNGAGAVGKSLLALQLAVAVAAGASWLGRPVTGGRAIYISAEDDEGELHRRTRTIARSLSLSSASLAGKLTVAPLTGLDALLATPNGRTVLSPTPLFAEVEEFLVEEQPSLLVIDTLGRTFGGDENQRNQAQAFVGLLQGLCTKHDLTILVLAHPSLSGLQSGSGNSGSTAWEGAVRSRLYMERPKGPDNDFRFLTTKKANYTKQGSALRLEWRRGVFVVVEAQPEPAATDDAAAQRSAEGVFLALVEAAVRRGEVLSDRPGKNFAPAIMARRSEGASVGKAELTNAMKRLLEAGRIKSVQKGSDTRKRRHLEVMGGPEQ